MSNDAMSNEPDRPYPTFTILTGMSGAGRSETAKCLEDLGYFVVDNLPPVLIERMAELVTEPARKVDQVALVVDSRGRQFFLDLQKSLSELAERGFGYRIVFLEAGDKTLVRRFVQTRRRHPLAENDRILEGIIEERRVLEQLRDQADVIVDTSDLNVHELRDRITALFTRSASDTGMSVNVVSFGYKHGLPMDADMVLDCRFLPNPHWVEDLRPLNGTTPAVRDYVLNAVGTRPFLKRAEQLIDAVLPGFAREGRHYLTLAVGCTGGRHRSVVVADELACYIREADYAATVVHRDLEKE